MHQFQLGWKHRWRFRLMLTWTERIYTFHYHYIYLLYTHVFCCVCVCMWHSHYNRLSYKLPNIFCKCHRVSHVIMSNAIFELYHIYDEGENIYCSNFVVTRTRVSRCHSMLWLLFLFSNLFNSIYINQHITYKQVYMIHLISKTWVIKSRGMLFCLGSTYKSKFGVTVLLKLKFLLEIVF